MVDETKTVRLQKLVGAKEAMKVRSTTIDLLLVFAAAFVITLSWWPKEQPRQLVRCNAPETGWETYSIALDDPRLADLQQRLDEWTKLESDSSFMAAQWEKETAEFYLKESAAENTSDASEIATEKQEAAKPTNEPAIVQFSDTIATASYETPVLDLPPTEPALETTESLAVKPEPTSDREHWQSVLDKANSTIAAAKQTKAKPPVVIQGQTGAGWPQLAFHFAFLIGICSACAYMHWNKRAPIRRGMEFRDQPMAVLARLGTYGGVVCLAMLSALAIWI